MSRTTLIKKGDVWKVYNPQRTATREVVVVSSDSFNRFSDWHQVIPIDDTVNRKHFYDVRIRGKVVAIDLLMTITANNFLEKKSSASHQEMQDIGQALIEHFGLN